MKNFLISKEQIAHLLPMDECIDVMEKAFLSLAKGNCVQPLRPIMWLPDKTGALAMMPAYAAEIGVMGIKVLSLFPNNKKLGLSSHQGGVMLFETKSGQPLCLADADEITAIRTAAVSALATKELALKNAHTLAILGSGTQAHRHVEAILLVRKIRNIFLWSRNEAHAKELAEKVSAQFSVPISITTIEEAVKNADIICTTTASTEPIVKGDWLKPGVHINAVGACTPFTRELDTAAILKSKLYTDRYESLFNEAGDFLIPKNEGAINDSHVKGELGEVLSGNKKGRENEEEITVFKSLGLAIEDIYAAYHVFKKLSHA